jgi:glycosyltransferase involved in cell wall biosynthesis
LKRFLKYKIDFFSVYRLYGISHKKNNKNQTVPTIGLVIVSHGNNPYLEKTLRSVADQLTSPGEIVLVLSGNIKERKKAMKDVVNCKIPNLEIVETETNSAGFNRNQGASKINSEYLIFLDGDDVLKPKAIEIFASHVRLRSQTVIASSCALFPSARYYHVLPTVSAKSLKERNQIQVPALINRRKFLEIGGFRESAIPNFHLPEDWDFWYRLTLKFGAIKNVGDILHLYRIHNLSTTQLHGAKSESRKIFWKHAVIAKDNNYWRNLKISENSSQSIPLPVQAQDAFLLAFDDVKSLFEYFSRNSPKRGERYRVFVLNSSPEEIDQTEFQFKNQIAIYNAKSSFLNMKYFLNHLSHSVSLSKMVYVQPNSRISRFLSVST